MQTITVDIGGTTALFEMHLDGRVEQYKIATGERFNIERLNKHLTELESDYGFSEYGLAIGVPGRVENNRLLSSKVLPSLNGLSQLDIHSRAKNILLANDIDAGIQAICEPKHQCELLIMSGSASVSGIGMSIAMKGKSFTGASGVAGELGHCRVMTESGEFSLEQLAFGGSVHARGLKSSEDLFRAGSYLGMGIAWSVNLFNPNRIWLAGVMMNNDDYYKGCISALNNMALSAPMSQTKVSRVHDLETLVCRGLKEMLNQVDN